MGQSRQLAVVLALVLSLLTPTVACALPSAQMTAQEHTCCKAMKGKCSSMRMPASHSCCQPSIQTTHFDAVQPESVSGPMLAILAVLPSATLFNPRSLTDEHVSPPEQSPPSSPPLTVSVLRI